MGFGEAEGWRMGAHGSVCEQAGWSNVLDNSEWVGHSLATTTWPVSRCDGFIEKERTMKPISWVGILLIVIGGLALAYQGFDYTHQEKVLDVGPIHATAEEQKHVSIPPVLGGLVLVGGIALVIVGARKKS
jgi:uncharacterized membrane protein